MQSRQINQAKRKLTRQNSKSEPEADPGAPAGASLGLDRAGGLCEELAQGDVASDDHDAECCSALARSVALGLNGLFRTDSIASGISTGSDQLRVKNSDEFSCQSGVAMKPKNGERKMYG